jgi:hypothetical protein
MSIQKQLVFYGSVKLWSGQLLASISALCLLGACSRVPSREKFPGAMGQTTDVSSAETQKGVMGGFDPLNTRLPGQNSAGLSKAMFDDSKVPPGESIRGEVILARNVVIREGFWLFIAARTADGGPPVAVKRMPAPEFPYKFTLSKNDSMMGGQGFEGELEITVRLDQDGDPMSRQKGDFFGTYRAKVGDQNLQAKIDQEVSEAN